MKQSENYIECDYRVLSQFVRIQNVNFRDESFDVFTELSLAPLRSGLRKVILDVGPDILLPKDAEQRHGRVTVNDHETSYEINIPIQNLSSETGNVSRKFLTDARCRVIHELVIDIPESCADCVDDGKVIVVGINATVLRAKKGVQFVSFFNSDGILESGAHLFTYRSDVLSSTYEWLPCLDSPQQICFWKFEMIVDNSLMAIASGELIETIYKQDMHQKTFYHQLLVPTSAANIGFVIGHFIPYVRQDLPEIISFSLPGVLSLVKHTVSTVDRAYEFFEELLACRFPYSSYKQVFVNQAADHVIPYAGLSILSVDLLYHKKIIDVVQKTRTVLAAAIAQQFFGCFVTVTGWMHLWITKSLSRFIIGLYIERFFGKNEYMTMIRDILITVCEYEDQWGKVFLSRKADSVQDSCTNSKTENYEQNLFNCSPTYAEIVYKKGHFILRMLMKRLGTEPFFQVIHKILGVAMKFSQLQNDPANWYQMCISTDSFFETVCNVTGNAIPTFRELWIYGGGHADFNVQFSLSRRRSSIRIEINQDASDQIGCLSYVGPISLVVQELDGSFTHSLQIDSIKSKLDLSCHSKGRRQKKKKIPLSNNVELEIDLGNLDPESHVLWIRVDPDLLLFRKMRIRQPIYHWEYMLKYERDVLAQFQALDVLRRFPSPSVKTVLFDAVENKDFYYKVRCRAAFCLSEVISRLPEAWTGSHCLLTLYEKLYCSKSCPNIPKRNSFVVTSTNLQVYFLMQALPQALGRIQSTSSAHFRDILIFVLGLIKYNDNSINRYSDDHFRASLITALSNLVYANERMEPCTSPDLLSGDMKALLTEITHALNMDILKPSFGRVVGISALQAIYKMQISHQLPLDSKIFWSFARFGIYSLLRRASFAILVDMVHRFKASFIFDTLLILLDWSVNDRDPVIRHFISHRLCKQWPLMAFSGSEINALTAKAINSFNAKIWSIIIDGRTDNCVRFYYLELWNMMNGPDDYKPLSIESCATLESNEAKFFRPYRPGKVLDFVGEYLSWYELTSNKEEPDSSYFAMYEKSDDTLA